MHRRQIPATGWSAVYSHEDGSFSTDPLVCWELICADPEDDDNEIWQDDKSTTVHRDGSRTTTPDWHGTATKAVGRTFFEPQPSRTSDRQLDFPDEAYNFIGYLPPGKDLEEWLKDLPAKKEER